jgi:hypothetical protein
VWHHYQAGIIAARIKRGQGEKKSYKWRKERRLKSVELAFPTRQQLQRNISPIAFFIVQPIRNHGQAFIFISSFESILSCFSLYDQLYSIINVQIVYFLVNYGAMRLFGVASLMMGRPRVY